MVDFRDYLRPLVQSRRALLCLRFIESLKYMNPHVISCQKNYDRGSKIIYNALQSSGPQAIGKIGSVELSAIKKYLRYKNHDNAEKKTALDREILYNNAGVYPNDYPTYNKYCDYMINQILPELTILGVWFNLEEASIVKKYANNAKHLPIVSFETYAVRRDRWTRFLENKTVLIIHPFKHSIINQYDKRNLIWTEPDVLPKFKLKIIQPPFAPSLLKPSNESWFESLENLKSQMRSTEFDIAMIGAGAYSLPLAVFAKQLGKHGIHIGGALQLYFGIYGNRWVTNKQVRNSYNNYWIRPLPKDTPSNNILIENGCYW